jgi:hypothetical protein
VRPWAESWPKTTHSFLNFSEFCLLIKIPGNSLKLLKFIENHINLKKIESEFHWNALEQIYAVGLTKSLFVHYCLVENSHTSNLEHLITKIHTQLNLQTLHAYSCHVQ